MPKCQNASTTDVALSAWLLQPLSLGVQNPAHTAQVDEAHDIGQAQWLDPANLGVCRHNMEASVTLHWFVHPRWFDELGGWRRSENVRYYVEWAELAFKLWGQCLHTPPISGHLINWIF